MRYRKTAEMLGMTVLTFLLVACERGQDAPAEPAGRWQKIVEIHPVERTKVVQMMISAQNKLPTQKDIPSLVLSCQVGETNAYVIWRQYLGAYDLDVTWRAGSAPEVIESWSLSTDSEAIFAPDAVEFIKQVMLYDVLLVKTTPFNSEPMTVVFDTSNLDREITELREACKW